LSKQNDILRQLQPIFYPRSLAVVGTSPDDVFKFNAGNLFFTTLIEFGYSGQIYPVGKSAGHVCGREIYSSVNDIPGELDYVIAAIPNRLIPQLVEDCGRKGVKAIHLFASGFGEIEDSIGLELQQQFLHIARKYNIRLLGPNCMGVYCPDSRLTFQIGCPNISGKVGYLSQSGGQSTMGIKEATRRNVYFSKVVSYGNAADINECDLIEYFTADPDTEIMTIYIEGTNHGRRLLKVLKEASLRKPVVIFKCAATRGGSQAAISHTSAIAGSDLTWDSLIRQTGAIRVYNVQEMFDAVSVLQRYPALPGLRTLLVGHGGGSCVQASDDCCRAGLELPMLPERYRKKLMEIYLTDAGNIFRNPLDINPYWGIDKVKDAFSAVASWPDIDLIVLLATPEQTPFMPRQLEFQTTTDTIIEWSRLADKPVVSAMNVNTIPGDDGIPYQSLSRVIEAGFPVFPSTTRAATAVARVYRYYRWLEKFRHK